MPTPSQLCNFPRGGIGNSPGARFWRKPWALAWAPSLAPCVPCEPLSFGERKNGVRGGPRNRNFGLVSSEELSFQISRHSPPIPVIAWIFQTFGVVQATGGRWQAELLEGGLPELVGKG